MHGRENPDEELYKRASVDVRPLPMRTKCLVCGDHFSDWESRMEHVGRHVERGQGCGEGQGRVDEGLQEWGLRYKVLEREGNKVLLVRRMRKPKEDRL
jgi:hypothetical protein